MARSVGMLAARLLRGNGEHREIALWRKWQVGVEVADGHRAANVIETWRLVQLNAPNPCRCDQRCLGRLQTGLFHRPSAAYVADVSGNTGRVAEHHGVGRDGPGDHGARAYHRACAEPDARQYRGVSSNRGAILHNRFRYCLKWASPPGEKVIGKGGIRAYEHVIPKADAVP